MENMEFDYFKLDLELEKNDNIRNGLAQLAKELDIVLDKLDRIFGHEAFTKDTYLLYCSAKRLIDGMMTLVDEKKYNRTYDRELVDEVHALYSLLDDIAGL